MQIRIHKVEYQVDIAVIFSPDHILQADYIIVTIQLLQKYDLSKCPLGVCCILKGVKVLLDCNNLLCLLVNCLPDYTVCSLPYKLTGMYEYLVRVYI